MSTALNDLRALRRKKNTSALDDLRALRAASSKSSGPAIDFARISNEAAQRVVDKANLPSVATMRPAPKKPQLSDRLAAMERPAPNVPNIPLTAPAGNIPEPSSRESLANLLTGFAGVPIAGALRNLARPARIGAEAALGAGQNIAYDALTDPSRLLDPQQMMMSGGLGAVAGAAAPAILPGRKPPFQAPFNENVPVRTGQIRRGEFTIPERPAVVEAPAFKAGDRVVSTSQTHPDGTPVRGRVVQTAGKEPYVVTSKGAAGTRRWKLDGNDFVPEDATPAKRPATPNTEKAIRDLYSDEPDESLLTAIEMDNAMNTTGHERIEVLKAAKQDYIERVQRDGYAPDASDLAKYDTAIAAAERDFRKAQEAQQVGPLIGKGSKKPTVAEPTPTPTPAAKQPWSLASAHSDMQTEPGYVYHATNTERAMDIAETGLKTHKPHEFTDQTAWPDGSTEKRAYFSERADNVWQFAPEEGASAVLRVKQDAGSFAKESTGDIFTTKSIPPSKIEVWGTDGQWHPLSESSLESRYGGTPRGKVQAKEEVAAKQPWEMTRDEFTAVARDNATERARNITASTEQEARKYEATGEDTRAWEIRQKANSQIERLQQPVNDAAALHDRMVRHALSEGKPVPPEVLADYPDLAARGKGEGAATPRDLESVRKELGMSVKDMQDPANQAVLIEAGVDPAQFKTVGETPAERINAAVPKAEPPLPALSVQQVTRSTPGGGSPFRFTDPIMEAEYKGASGGIQKDSLLARTRAGVARIYNTMTRTNVDLPRGPKFAVANDSLRYLGHQKSVASRKTLEFLQDITLDLDRPRFDAFSRKVLLDDLAQTAGRGEDLPFGWTPEQVATEKARLDAYAAGDPALQAALVKRQQAWDKIKTDYKQAMADAGFDVSKKLDREDYFHHQVMDFMDAERIRGAGKELRTPTGRGFLKKRVGSERPISTNYLQAEYEVMAQMQHDAELAKVIKTLKDKYDIASRVRAEAKRNGIEDWHRAIPNDHTTWQPREGNVFYVAESLPEKVVKRITEALGEEVGVTSEELKNVLAMGGKRTEWVIPKELAATLDNMPKNPQEGVIGSLSRRVQTAWKQYVLLNPKRFVKYNLRNLTGDAEAVFVGNPSAFRKVPEAIKELYQTHKTTRSPMGELREWMDRGGSQGLLQTQEMGEVDKLAPFIRLMEQGKKPNLWQRYWRGARLTTDFRESILRYSAYLDYLDQLRANGGRPKNFGASIKEEVMALPDVRDRAYKLSNELLGAYDQISAGGKELRAHAYPFWSWAEVNFGRTIRMARNQTSPGQVAGSLTRKAAVGTAKTAYGATKFAAKAAGMWTLLQVYNNLRYPDEEAELPDYIKGKPHIVLGRNKDGTVNYLSRLGAIADFVEWFGFDAPQQQVSEFLSGQKTPKEIAIDMAKVPVNKMVGGLFPLQKTALEATLGKSTFPDVFDPRFINKERYLLQQSPIPTDPMQLFVDVYDKRRYEKQRGNSIPALPSAKLPTMKMP